MTQCSHNTDSYINLDIILAWKLFLETGVWRKERETTLCESKLCTHCFELNDCHNLRLPNVQPLQKIIEWVNMPNVQPLQNIIEWVNICHLKIYFKQKIVHSMSLTVRNLFNLNGFFSKPLFIFSAIVVLQHIVLGYRCWFYFNHICFMYFSSNCHIRTECRFFHYFYVLHNVKYYRNSSYIMYTGKKKYRRIS